MSIITLIVIFIQAEESGLLELLAFADELLKRQISYEEFISLVEVVPDDCISTLVAESAEVFLFLLFEDEHLVTEVVLGKKPIYQHQIFTNIK